MTSPQQAESSSTTPTHSPAPPSPRSSLADHEPPSQRALHTKARPRLPAGSREPSLSMVNGLTTDGPPSPKRVTSEQGALSPGTIDRVFPVRSAVSIDPSATPMPQAELGDSFPGFTLPAEGAPSMKRDHSSSQGRGVLQSPASSERSYGNRRDSMSGRHTYSDLASSRANPSSSASGVRRVSRGTDTTPTAKVDTHVLQNLVAADNLSVKSEVTDGSADGDLRLSDGPGSIRSSEDVPLVTARFKHLVSDGGHAVITGRDGDVLQRCEDEPIHIPGAVQSFGCLLAFREEDSKLVVRVVSENCDRFLGYNARQLFALNSLLDIFSDEQADNLLDHLDFIRDDATADVVANGPEVFMLSIRSTARRTAKLWCAMHVCDSDHELIICEFELEDDQKNPLIPVGEGTPDLPQDTLGSNPTAQELEESTVNLSKPLRILRNARKKRGEAAAMEIFNILSQVQEQLASAPDLTTFLRVLIGVVKELTGFHRVMIYQFDQSWNGRVVAELVDPRATKDLYKGLNFPASDIPKQARDLYKVNKVRLLYDRDQETARLVCRTMEDLEKPLDLTHAYLRAMSPIHIKYLSHMAVRSSMSISINAFDELWGLIACHTYGMKGMRVSFPIRKMCRLVGDTASRNIERLSYASRLQARKLINTASTASNPAGYIVASSDDLLRLFDADVGALSIRNETKVMGKVRGHLQEVLAMVEYLRLRRISAVHTSPDIATDFPDLRYAPGLKFLAGLLYVPLSHHGEDFIVFFRKGVSQEVKWAGNPYEKFVKEGTEGYLEPRTSFKSWSETIVGRCRDWTEEEVETASVLCLVYGKFIDVWRQKEAALQNSQLTKLLLANSAHEVRTPLNAIINYLEIALESSLDGETRDNLVRSHSASKSLVYVINDLLDLTKAEGGNELVKDEAFILRDTMIEATNPFSGDAKRKNIEYSVWISPDFPNQVIGDHRRVRQVVSNLVANAIQHTQQGRVAVEAWVVQEESAEDKVDVEIAVEDTGVGMSQARVDALFRELEEVSYEENVPDTKLLDNDPFANTNDSDEISALGLGLAVVARTIRHMNGQLRLKTEVGKGSRFTIQLTFGTVDPVPQAPKSIEAVTPPLLSQNSDLGRLGTPTAANDGEVTLVPRSAKKDDGGSSMARRESKESLLSLHSNKSQTSLQSATSHKSDVDRLINAISEPLHTPAQTSGNSLGQSASRSRSVDPDDFSPTRQKSHTFGSTRDFHTLSSAMSKIPGQEKVAGSGVPIRPVKMPEQGTERNRSGRKSQRVVFQEPDKITASPSKTEVDPSSAEHFSVLVAEDDPINSKIVKKRLEKLGHAVHLTVNGEECSSAHGEQASTFDAVLMDLQMPIVDGFTSTRMIRSFEKTRPNECLSLRAKTNGRIPIFAVSASLVERDRERYIETGFDGWILKPVDFRRVDLLLRGIVDDESRNQCLYTPGAGNWEKGGWFQKRTKRSDADVLYAVDTRPTSRLPSAATQNLPKRVSSDVVPEAGRQAAKPEGVGNAWEDPKHVEMHPVVDDTDKPIIADATPISTRDSQEIPPSSQDDSSVSARPRSSIPKADTI